MKNVFFIVLLASPFCSMAVKAENIDTLITQCASQTPSYVAHAIIKTESSYNPFAIGVNKNGKSVGGYKKPKTYNEAVVLAKQLIANGNNIDLGLAQINSANLPRLNLTVESVLNPCTNLSAMQYILSGCFQSAGNNGYGDKIQRAFSCYNTGNHKKGFYNGYVNKVTNNMNNRLAKGNSKQYIPLPNNQNIAQNSIVNAHNVNYNQQDKIIIDNGNSLHDNDALNQKVDSEKFESVLAEKIKDESKGLDIFSTRQKNGFF